MGFRMAFTSQSHVGTNLTPTKKETKRQREKKKKEKERKIY